MIKVIMMCGICGSGKTTYAKQKEKEGYVRLSIDEEMWKTYGRKGIDYPNEQYEKLSEIVEMALQKELLSLIQQGKHVVLDFSFWNKANRAYYKRLIEKAGGTPELVYMKASKGTLQKRLYKRNQSLNANSPFIITNEILEHHYNDFQEPCGEGEKVILQEEDCVGAAIDSPYHLWWLAIRGGNRKECCYPVLLFREGEFPLPKMKTTNVYAVYWICAKCN